MKRSLFMLVVIGALVSGSASLVQGKTVIFFVGGWRMTAAQMESFSGSVPESRKVTYLLPNALSELVRPWHCAELVNTYIQDNNLANENFIFVTFSFGGTVTQWLLNAHPEYRVQKLILVGSPVGGYKFLPPNNFFSNRFPSNLPIYVIAGTKGQDAWFLQDENDGVVDLRSALNIPDENQKDAAIFHADHTELEEIAEVQQQIALWLGLGKESLQRVSADSDPQVTISANNRQLFITADKVSP